jgi:chromosome segregation ATPase
MDELTRWKNKVADSLEKAHNAEVEYNDLGEQFAKIKAQTFDESQNICQYCGQELPENRKEENRKRFINEQERQKALINTKAIGVRDTMRQAKDDAQVADARMKEYNAAVIDAEKKIAVMEQSESKLSKEISVTGTEEYKKLTADMESIQKQIDEYNELVSKRDIEKASIREKKDELRNVRNQIAVALNNANINARISALRMELKDVGQKIADSDKLIYVLENYVKFLADKINDRFEGLEFKLFETQINGGVKETCTITYNGVPYSDLNSGHRIVVGLKIIKTLQKLYDTAAPVFTDNAETLNDFNMPDMDCQVIALRVSDNKTLAVQ